MIAVMSTRSKGINRNAATKEPVAFRNQTETNGHSTTPMKKATDHENPLPTPRVRVGYISGPHTPMKPNDQAMPRSHNANLPSAKIQMVRKNAASNSRMLKPIRRPRRSIIQPPSQNPSVENKAHQM